MARSEDDKLFDDIVERELFLELVAAGTPEQLAGHEVGWTPRQTKRNLADREFAELIEHAKTRRDDSVERVLYKLAIEKHNFQAIAMILLNRRASEFRDVKKIEVQTKGTITHDHVLSVKEGLKELMAENGIDAFQIGGALDRAVIDAESSEDTDEQ